MYEIIKYPDGGKYVSISAPFEEMTYRINSYDDLFMLRSIKNANPNLKRITIPCMFQQQHDKKFNKNESFELKLVCDFINDCNFEKVTIFHPHSDVTPALLSNCEVIDNSNFITKVLLKIRALENLILFSSDAGGFKPLIKLAAYLEWDETFSASKSRDSHTHKLTQMIDKMDFQGKDILIVDDICVYGGTFIGLAKMLEERNVGKKYLAVSHTTVEQPNPELFKFFDKVFTTNSKGIDYYVSGKEYGIVPTNLEIIKLF